METKKDLEGQHEQLTRDLVECEKAAVRLKSLLDQMHLEIDENKQKKLAIEIKLSQVEQNIREKE